MAWDKGLRTNYDDVAHIFKEYASERIKAATKEEREQIAERLLPIFMERGPVQREYDDAFYLQQFKTLREKTGEWSEEEGLVLNERSPACTALCRSHCRGLSLASTGKNSTLEAKFKNEKAVRDAILWLMKLNKSLTPLGIEDKIKVTGDKNTPSIFLPSRAKVIYDRYVPENGVVFDYAFGWGSRALGALASDKVRHYIGVDPNTLTHKDVSEMLQRVCLLNGLESSYELYCVGSEDFELEKESVDFAFSSPPYFTLEIYSDESTQSVVKFPNYEDWLEQFVRPTIKNIVQGLKFGGRLGINVKNFKKIKLEEDWVRIAIEEGLVLKEKVMLLTTGRPGVGVDKRKAGEPVFILQKVAK